MTRPPHKYSIWTVLQYLLIAGAYAYLIYRLVQYDHYAELGELLTKAGWQYAYLAIALCLVPLNIFFEAGKWRQLLTDVEPMSYGEAQRQTYFGFVGAFLTPARLGDYPARVTQLQHKEHWLTAVALGFIGTLALDFTIVFIGLPATFAFVEQQAVTATESHWAWIAGSVSIAVLVLLIVFYPQIAHWLSGKVQTGGKTKEVLQAIARFSHKRFLSTTGWSMLRYLTFAVQFYLVLAFCGIKLPLPCALLSIPTYYLLITLTPSVTIADPAVRGSWAIAVFSFFTDNTAAIALAAVMVWVLNTVLPMLIGSALGIRKQ